jgi:hypothetical protein
MEVIMQHIKEMEGVKTVELNTNNLRYADDTVLLAGEDKKQCYWVY